MALPVKRFVKKENGFSLIELLAVIVILAVIAAVAVPMIGDIINQTKQKAEIATARSLYEAAKLYNIGHRNSLNQTVQLSTLLTENFIEPNLINPRTNEPIDGTSEIKFDASGNFESVKIVDSKYIVTYSADIVIAGSGDPMSRIKQ